MFMTSLVTKSTVDPELFPLLSIRSCISEAEESANGPRFCAQDNYTGCAYEVRCVKLNLSGPSTALSENDKRTLKKQQCRIDALTAAAASGRCPPSAILPVDVYIQEQKSSGVAYVAAVDAFTGLSLGDIVRSGWNLLEENVMLEILNAVEQFGCASSTLPPHGNLSADAVKQLLTVRDGAAEAEKRSRWVVGDWLLLYDEENEEHNAQSLIADIDWVLHSTFAQLRVSSAVDGSFLSAKHIDELINETVERIRDHLRREPTNNTPETVDDATMSPSERAQGTGEGGSCGLSASAVGVSSSADYPSGAPSFPFGANSAGPGGSEEDFSGTSLSRPSPSRDVMDLVRDLSLRDKVSYHQSELRKDQQLANKYRRRTAPLPPLPSPAPTTNPRQSYEEEESAEYEMQYLTSPVRPRASKLLTEAPPVSQANKPSKPRPQSAPSLRTVPTGRHGSSTTPSPHAQPQASTPMKKVRGDAKTDSAQSRPSVREDCKSGDAGVPEEPEDSREVLLENVIALALMTQGARQEKEKNAREMERMNRNSLKAFLARSAAMEQAGQHPTPKAQTPKKQTPAATPTRLYTHPPAARRDGKSTEPPRIEKGHGDRRRAAVGTLPSRQKHNGDKLQPQLSSTVTASIALGSAGLIQVSNSSPSPLPPSPDERAVTLDPSRTAAPAGTTKSPPAARGAPSASRATQVAGVPASGTAGSSEPLPLEVLLARREKLQQERQQHQQQNRSAGSRPWRTSDAVQRTERSVSRGGRTGAVAPAQSTPRGGAPSPGTPPSGNDLRRGSLMRERSTPKPWEARASRSPSLGTRNSPGPSSRKKPGTPNKRAGLRSTTPPHAPGHPHGLLSNPATPVPHRTREGASASGTSDDSAHKDPAETAATHAEGVTQKNPPRTAAGDRTSQIQPGRVQSPKSAGLPAQTVHRTGSPHERGRHREAVSSFPQAARTRSTSAGNRAGPRSSPQRGSIIAPRRGSLSPVTRHADSGSPNTRTRQKRSHSASDNVTRRGVAPVHEASVGIANRRKHAGALDGW